MLRSNLDAYLTQSSSATVKALSRVAIFTKHTAASPTAAWQGTSLISLADSADGQYHSLVSTAVDVIDPAMGDTTHLRQQLGLQPGPVLVHVVQHLLNTATTVNSKQQSNTAATTVSSVTQNHCQTAYEMIIKAVNKCLKQDSSELPKITQLLAGSARVLVHNKEFVAADILYTKLDEETDDGKLYVDQMPSCTTKLLVLVVLWQPFI